MTELNLPIRYLLDLLPDAVLLVDHQGVITHANQAVTPLLGHGADELVGQALELLLPESARSRHQMLVRQFAQFPRSQPMGKRPVLTAVHKSGHEVPVTISLSHFQWGEAQLMLAVIADAMQMFKVLEQANVQAQTDPLTGLGNRLGLQRRMQSWIDRQRPFSLLFLDLSKFKPLNDEYGHPFGDQVLCHLSKVMTSAVRDGDLAARVGGDEFVLLFDGLKHRSALEARAWGFVEKMTEPIEVEGQRVQVGVNIGGAMYPADAQDMPGLMKLADQRMYEAKRAGNSVCVVTGTSPQAG